MAVAAMSAVLAVWSLIQESSEQALALEQDSILEVKPGDTFNQVLSELSRQGIVRHNAALRVWLRLERSTANIKTGDYELRSGSTIRDLLNLLVSGKVKQYQLTLIEGWTFDQALAQIQASPRIRITLDAGNRRELAGLLGAQNVQGAIPLSDSQPDDPEGLIFPDTYHYIAGTTDADILRRAHVKLRTVLDGAWQNRLGGLPFESPYEALVMASIIEKETGMESERDLIGSVFVNRLAQGMRLQSDPTVIYGLGESFDGNLTREHLNTVTPHNTYRNSGLPPTPIALAGRASLMAALRPAAGDMLYFVARGDGSHEFSRTLDEHNAAVRRYQLGGSQPQGN
jgi:UPF0755 protein